MRLNSSITLVITFLMAFFLADSCGRTQVENTSDKLVQQKTEQMMNEGNKQVGMPNINNWQEKKLVRDLYELRDQEDLLTYTYIINMHGDKIFLGRSIGYGIPASVQYSNPDKLVDVTDYGISSYQSNDGLVMSQPEPNGLFMPEGLSATWVFLIDGDGNPRATYVEPHILVSPFKLH